MTLVHVVFNWYFKIPVAKTEISGFWCLKKKQKQDAELKICIFPIRRSGREPPLCLWPRLSSSRLGLTSAFTLCCCPRRLLPGGPSPAHPTLIRLLHPSSLWPQTVVPTILNIVSQLAQNICPTPPTPLHWTYMESNTC